MMKSSEEILDSSSQSRKRSLRNSVDRSTVQSTYIDAENSTNVSHSSPLAPTIKRWGIGDVVDVPHLVLHNDNNENAISPKTRQLSEGFFYQVTFCPAVVIATFTTSALALPIVTGPQLASSSHKLMTMRITSAQHESGLTDGDDVPNLVVKDGEDCKWSPESDSYITLNQPVAIEYSWTSQVKAVLQSSSVRLLNQCIRFVYGTMMHMDLEDQDEQLQKKISNRFVSYDKASNSQSVLFNRNRETDENLSDNDRERTLSTDAQDLPPYSRSDKHPIFATKRPKQQRAAVTNTPTGQRMVGDRLPNGRYVCGHYKCDKINVTCIHACCKEGSRKKPAKSTIARAAAHHAQTASSNMGANSSRVDAQGSVKKPTNKGVATKLKKSNDKKKSAAAAPAEGPVSDGEDDDELVAEAETSEDDEMPLSAQKGKQSRRAREASTPDKHTDAEDRGESDDDSGSSSSKMHESPTPINKRVLTRKSTSPSKHKGKVKEATKPQPRPISATPDSTAKPSEAVGVTKPSRASPGPLRFKQYNVLPSPPRKRSKAVMTSTISTADPGTVAAGAAADPTPHHSSLRNTQSTADRQSSTDLVSPTETILATTMRTLSADHLSPISQMLTSERDDGIDTQAIAGKPHVSFEHQNKVEVEPSVPKAQDSEGLTTAPASTNDTGPSLEPPLKAFNIDNNHKHIPIKPHSRQHRAHQAQARLASLPPAAPTPAAHDTSTEEANAWLAAIEAGFVSRRSPPPSPSPLAPPSPSPVPRSSRLPDQGYRWERAVPAFEHDDDDHSDQDRGGQLEDSELGAGDGDVDSVENYDEFAPAGYNEDGE